MNANWKLLLVIFLGAAAISVSVICLFQKEDLFSFLPILPFPKAEEKKEEQGSTAESVAQTVSDSNSFAFDLYSNLKEKEQGNIFFSPYSVSSAFTMVYEGARTKTAEEIQQVFSFEKDDDLRRSSFAALYNEINEAGKSYKLNTANALWVQQDFKILNEYLNVLDKYYGGKATNVDFVGKTEQARQTINGWVEEKTNNKIKDLFPQGSLNSLTRLVLTNAVYFKATWLKQFETKATRNEPFWTNPENSVQTPMMSISDDFNYTETEDLQVLEMLYDGEDLSMLILLPKENNIETLEEQLSLANIEQWKRSLAEKEVEVFIPKFTFTTKYSLNNNLAEMGMPSAFSPGEADLSGIDGARRLFIQQVIHQAFVDVNEEGTEAAAATGIIMAPTAISPAKTVFRADHPFIFLIQDRASGNILFMGRVANPI